MDVQVALGDDDDAWSGGSAFLSTPAARAMKIADAFNDPLIPYAQPYVTSPYATSGLNYNPTAFASQIAATAPAPTPLNAPLVTIAPLPNTSHLSLTFTPLRSGIYLLPISLTASTPQPNLTVGLRGSPYFVAVLPGAMDAPSTTLSGAALTQAQVGAPTSVLLTPRDAFGNRCGRAGVDVGYLYAALEELQGSTTSSTTTPASSSSRSSIIRPLPLPNFPGQYALLFSPMRAAVPFATPTFPPAAWGTSRGGTSSTSYLRVESVRSGKGLFMEAWGGRAKNASDFPPFVPSLLVPTPPLARYTPGVGALLDVPSQGFSASPPPPTSTTPGTAAQAFAARDSALWGMYGTGGGGVQGGVSGAGLSARWYGYLRPTFSRGSTSPAGAAAPPAAPAPFFAAPLGGTAAWEDAVASAASPQRATPPPRGGEAGGFSSPEYTEPVRLVLCLAGGHARVWLTSQPQSYAHWASPSARQGRDFLENVAMGGMDGSSGGSRMPPSGWVRVFDTSTPPPTAFSTGNGTLGSGSKEEEEGGGGGHPSPPSQ